MIDLFAGARHTPPAPAQSLAPSETPRLGRRGDRRKAALVSVVVHLALGLAIFGSLSGGGIRGAPEPFGEGDAIQVSLGGREGAAAARAGQAAEAPQVESLESLAQRLRDASSDNYVSQPEPQRAQGSLSELFDTIGKIAAPGRKGDGADRAGQDGAGAQTKKAMASRQGEAGDAASAGDLWGQVEPCWKRLPKQAAAPVTLDVVLDGGGRLARPPKIVRAPGARLDERQLVAEAKALTAIQACLPYRTVGALVPGQVQRLTFGR